MRSNEYFLLFANCIIVRGAGRSTICDLQKGCYVFIPNFVSDFLKDLEILPIKDVLRKNSQIKKKDFYKYLNYLVENDLGHFCSSIVNFPKINSSYITPNKIEDCIIELSDTTFNNMSYIIKSLSNLGCRTIELRSYSNFFSLEKISKIIELLKNSQVRNLELYIKQSDKITIFEYRNFLELNQIVGLLVIHSCMQVDSENDSRLVFTKNVISRNCCGHISKDDFVINLPFYIESLSKNSCLNRKVAICENGDIKNCPSLEIKYGNISNSVIEKIIKKPQFKKLWNINKDRIEVCKDCEFRYICSDCRAYLDSDFSKPKNCKYDPYSMTYIT